MNFLRTAVATALLSAASINGFAADKDSFLQFIPADTPYAIASLTRFDRDEVVAIYGKYENLYGQMVPTLKRDLAKAAEDGVINDRQKAVFDLLITEVYEDFSAEKLESLGLRLDTHFAIYGLGIAPMLQMELSSEDKFRAFVKRIEDKAEEKLPVAEFNGNPYWRVGKDSDSAFAVAAIVDGRLAVALIPSHSADQFLPYLFGEKPEQSMAKSGELARLAELHGLGSIAAGVIDTRRMADHLYLKEKESLSAGWLEKFDSPPPEVSEACQQEIEQLAERFPRMLLGYPTMTADRMDVKMVLETNAELASQLRTLTQKVPGLGNGEGAMSLGVGINVVAAQKFAQEAIAAVSTAPYQCEGLLDLNDITQQQAGVGQPLPPFITDIKGLNLVIDSLDMPEGGMMPDVKARAMLRADNPMNLFAMAAMFSPEAAALELKPDGKAIALPPSVIPPFVAEPYAAITDAGLGVSVGADMHKALGDFMTQAESENPPIFAMSIDFSKMTDAMKTLMQFAAMQMEGEEQAQFQNEMELALKTYAMMGPMNMSLGITDKGVEMLVEMEIK